MVPARPVGRHLHLRARQSSCAGESAVPQRPELDGQLFRPAPRRADPRRADPRRPIRSVGLVEPSETGATSRPLVPGGLKCEKNGQQVLRKAGSGGSNNVTNSGHRFQRGLLFMPKIGRFGPWFLSSSQTRRSSFEVASRAGHLQ